MTGSSSACQAVRGGLSDQGIQHAAVTTTMPAEGLIESQPSLPKRIVVRLVPQPGWLQPVVEGLRRLSHLSVDWDSHGAGPVHLKCIVRALRLLDEMMCRDTPVPYVVPTPAGGVQFEWHTEQVDLEIELTPSLQIVVTLLDYGSF